MNANRASELGVGLIGLYFVVSGLVAIPAKLAAAVWIPDMMRMASHTVAKTNGPELASAKTLIVAGVLSTTLSMIPPIALLLARRRVAAWLMPAIDTPTLAPVKDVVLARVGIALLGAYLCTSGFVGIASTTAELIAPYNRLKQTGVLNLVSSLARLVSGWVLWRFSSPLAERITKVWSEEHGGA